MNTFPNSETTIELRLRQDGIPGSFRIADQRVVTDARDESLAPYGLRQTVRWSRPWLDPSASENIAEPIYAGPGWIGRSWRQVVCHQTASGYQLEIEGIATYWIASDGSYVQQTSSTPGYAAQLLAQTALGAPLVLALALSQTFCLHGSAVSANGGLVLFIGESGDGKSTLASYLDEKGSDYWQRIIDDTLPIRFGEDGSLVAMPHFPQLKVLAEDQPIHLVPEFLDLQAVYVLKPQDPALRQQVTTSQLSNSQSAMTLIQHTVGSRLFSPHLLASHFAFCSRLAAVVPVRALSFPHDWDSLPEIEALIRSDLARTT